LPDVLGFGVGVYQRAGMRGEMTKKTILDLITLMASFKTTASATIADMGDYDKILSGTKNSGKLRRLSLDITRKLAELRAGK